MTRTADEDETIVRDGFADKVRRTIGMVPFTDEAVAAYYCTRDPSTPTRIKVAVMAALAYFVVPVDAVPDFIALLGYGDDAAVFWAAWRAVKPYITEEHRTRSRAFLGGKTSGQGATFTGSTKGQEDSI